MPHSLNENAGLDLDIGVSTFALNPKLPHSLSETAILYFLPFGFIILNKTIGQGQEFLHEVLLRAHQTGRDFAHEASLHAHQAIRYAQQNKNIVLGPCGQMGQAQPSFQSYVVFCCTISST